MVTSLMVLAAVAVLVGIAVVSTGYGGELSSADPRRPGLQLPSGRTLAPADLERVRFSLGFWGYPPVEVEDVLDRAVQALAERDAHIADLEHRLLTRQLNDAGDADETANPEAGEEESW